ncbi:hypothetical protein TNCV_4832161 [Trichonephila clavipes]|nr:hypothetical protein TNCV_4832161 [Trichonephila clavipes]
MSDRVKLQIFGSCSLSGDRFCDEIIRSEVHLFRGALNPSFTFMGEAFHRSNLTPSVYSTLELFYAKELDLVNMKSINKFVKEAAHLH